jgi:CheY-like chemotaxis protein
MDNQDFAALNADPTSLTRAQRGSPDWAFDLASAYDNGLGDDIEPPTAVAYLDSIYMDSSTARRKSARNYSDYIDGDSCTTSGSESPSDMPELNSLKRNKSFGGFTSFDIVKSNTVLVVDDSASCRRILSHSLQDLGYECELATDGDEACRMVEVNRDRYCAIMMDFRMSRMDGLCATSYIRNILKSRVPIILITGEDVDMPLKETGVDEVLKKPVETSDVNDAFINLQINIEIIHWKDGSKTYFEMPSVPRYDAEFVHMCNDLSTA